MVPFTSKGRSSQCSRLVALMVKDGVVHVEARPNDTMTQQRFLKKQREKEEKLGALPPIEPNYQTMAYQYIKDLDLSHDNAKADQKKLRMTRIYAHAGGGSVPPNLPPKDSIVWKVEEFFAPFTGFDGGRNATVCTMVPRQFVIDTHGGQNNFNKLFWALKEAIAMTDCSSESYLENTHRRVVCEDGNNRICLAGAKVQQGNGGKIKDRFLPSAMKARKVSAIKKFFSRVDHIVKSYLDTNSIVGLGMLNELLEHGSLNLTKDCQVKSYFPSIAIILNGYVSLHVDEDFSLSVLTIVAKGILKKNSPILVYFCHPSIGRAMGLRCGDVVAFDPREPHFMSSRVDPSIDVICCAQYFKTGVAGRNDNQQDLSEVGDKKLYD